MDHRPRYSPSPFSDEYRPGYDRQEPQYFVPSMRPGDLLPKWVCGPACPKSSDVSCDVQSPGFKRKSTIFGSKAAWDTSGEKETRGDGASGVEEFSGKAAWNTSEEKETGGDSASGVEEFSGKTGHFARKCSLGGNINGGSSGGGNMGKALATRMP